MDHLFAAIHAEVDVEVGHGHAFRVQEPLEQKAITKRIKIRDRKRVGDERTRARTTARPDGNIVVLRPFDEVGDDQEVAGEAHPLDDLQLEIEPFLIFLHARRMGDDRKPRLKPFIGLSAQFLHLVIGEFRQDRVDDSGAIGAAAGDLHRVFDGFRQVGEKRLHLRRRLEPVLHRQTAAVFLIHIGALPDAEKGVMRLIHLRIGEIDVVGGDERQVAGICLLNEPAFGGLFLRRMRLTVAAVPLKFDVKTVAEESRHMVQQLHGGGLFVVAHQHAKRAKRATREADHALRMFRQMLNRYVMRLIPRLQIGDGRERHQVQIPSLRLRNDDDGRRRRRLLPRLGRWGVGKVKLAANDRLHPRLHRRFREFQRAK